MIHVQLPEKSIEPSLPGLIFLDQEGEFNELNEIEKRIFISKVVELCQKSSGYFDAIKYLLEEGAHHLTDKHFSEIK